jgi:hypothetical protein
MHSIPLLMRSFSDFRKDFPFFDTNPHCWYPCAQSQTSIGSIPVLLQIAAKAGIIPTVRFWDGKSIYFDEEDARDPRVALLTRSAYVVFEGWDFRSRQAILRAREKIKSVFTPRSNIEQEVQKRLRSMRSVSDVVVGVHVRWEDYRGTDRFLELTEYVTRMNEIRLLLSPRKVAFMRVSPEEIPIDSLPAGSYMFPQIGALEDMYSLAECDYLAGPPSTFSMWASYYGGHPLFLLKSGRSIEDLSAARMATP